MTPSVAVIIPTYNDSARLKGCLDALTQQTYPAELVRILVVDNGSTEDIKSLVAQYDNGEYLFEGKPGAYHARNKALDALTDQHIVAFTDADCIPDPQWLVNAVQALSEPGVKGVGGRVSVLVSDPEQPTLAERYEQLFAFPQQLYVEQDRFAVTANLVVHREVVDCLGHFDAQLFSGGDAEWGARMHRHNLRLVYRDDVVVAHPARDTLAKLTRKVKRTVGGCYAQRGTNPVMAKSFQLAALLRGFMPPLRAIKRLFSSSEKVNVWQKTGLVGLLFYLKYHHNLIKIAYRLKLIRDFERF